MRFRTRHSRPRAMVLAAAALSVVLTGCGSGSDSSSGDLEQSEITVAGAKTLDKLAYFVAEDQGFFEDEGITKVDWIDQEAGAAVTSLLVSGEADISSQSVNVPWQAVSTGNADLKVIASATNGSDHYLAVQKEWAESHDLTADSTGEEIMAALDGAKVGSTPAGGSLHQLVTGLFDAYGVTCTIVPADGGAAMLANFEKGRSDAMVHVASTATVAGERYGAVMYRVADTFDRLPQLTIAPTQVFLASQQFLDQDPKLATAFTRALYRGAQYAVENPDDARRIATDEFGELPDLAWSAVYDGLKANGTRFGEEQFDASLDIVNLGLPAKEQVDVTFKDVVDDSLYDDVAKELGPIEGAS